VEGNKIDGREEVRRSGGRNKQHNIPGEDSVVVQKSRLEAKRLKGEGVRGGEALIERQVKT